MLAALGLGLLADALVRVDGRPGVNVVLWAIAGVVAIVVLLRNRADPVSRETRWLLGAAVGFSLPLMLRDADSLAAISFLSSLLLLGLAAGRATSAWAVGAHVSEVVVAGFRMAFLCVAGPLAWGRGTPAPSTGARWLRTAVRGTLMALPALLVLTALLMSADPLFARLIREIFLIDLERLIEHVVFTAVIAWLTAGYLRTLLIHDDGITDSLRVPKPSMPAPEVSIALTLLNVMFAVFMVVQLRYLFGGAALIEVTPGLTYAEYARRGFFELVVAAALVVPILLLADWLVTRERQRAYGVLRATMLVLVVLLIGVIASAAYRMRLYETAYGLTELRLYVSAFIVWLTAVLVWLVLTVLRGRRETFAFASIVTGLVCVVVLHSLNPHALIVRRNIDRAVVATEIDGRYLRTLSADAVPTLLARLDRLPEEERCGVARMLEERWEGERRGGWRTWNLSDWRARRLVRNAAAPHRAYAGCEPTASAHDSRKRATN